MRGGQHIASKHNSQIVMPPLVRGAQVSVSHHRHQDEASLPTPDVDLVVSPFRQPITMTAQQIASLRQQQQHSGSGPPPLLLAPRASVPNVQAQGQRIIQQGLIRVANVANSNVMVNIPQVATVNKVTLLMTNFHFRSECGRNEILILIIHKKQFLFGQL